MSFYCKICCPKDETLPLSLADFSVEKLSRTDKVYRQTDRQAISMHPAISGYSLVENCEAFSSKVPLVGRSVSDGG